MKKKELNRRQFNALTAAAFGGIVTGTIAGCGGKDKDKAKDKDKGKDGSKDKGANKDGTKTTPVAMNDWSGDKHVCRGLNACKGKGGAGGMNECAGQGQCATAAPHSCHGKNDCKFQGGCDTSVAANDCKGKGACAVPLKEGAWTKARASFEAAMKKDETKFGDAPAAKKAG